MMIHSIQYLRAIAALMVVWHHARIQLPGLQEYFTYGNFESGVDVFFVVSGFIMVATTHDKTVSPLQFMRRRVVRVVPSYWLLTLLMTALAILLPSVFRTLQIHPDTLIKSLLFIPHYSRSFPEEIWPLLVPGWTLNYEMFFYAVFALSLLINPARRLIVLAGSFLVLVAAGYAYGPFENVLASAYTRPIILEFVVGAVIAKLWFGGHLRVPLPIAVLFFFGGLVLLTIAESSVGLYRGVGAPLVVVAALNLEGRVRSPLLHALGDGSYSIYLTHLFSLGVLRFVWAKVLGQPASSTEAWAFMLLAMIVSAAVGWLFYRLIEDPMTKSLQARFTKG